MNILKTLFNIVIPNLCFICQEPLPQERRRLCPSCFDELSLLDPTNRCPFCFEEMDENCKSKCPCTNEREYPFFLSFCFPPLPAARWLEQDLKTKADDMIAGLSALMQLQLLSYISQNPITLSPTEERALVYFLARSRKM